jgi:short-subunit dehydrogenase
MARKWTRALITGASSGIGEELARQLAAQGANVVLVARSVDRLEALATELRDRSGVNVEVLGADLSDAAALATVEARVAATDDPIDLLVNNAGFGFNGTFGDIDVDDEDAEIRVNVLALMRLSHAAVNRMRSAAGGGILNVSSTSSFQPGPGSANYAATKAWVTSFSQALFEEHAEAGIVVTALCPGITRTGFQEHGGYDVSVPELFWSDSAEVARAGLEAVSSGRAIVVPGLVNKAMQVVSRLAPLSMARKGAARAFKVAR